MSKSFECGPCFSPPCIPSSQHSAWHLVGSQQASHQLHTLLVMSAGWRRKIEEHGSDQMFVICWLHDLIPRPPCEVDISLGSQMGTLSLREIRATVWDHTASHRGSWTGPALPRPPRATLCPGGHPTGEMSSTSCKGSLFCDGQHGSTDYSPMLPSSEKCWFILSENNSWTDATT